MNNEQKNKLKEYVSIGKWNFVFTYGVVRWGMLCALLFILFDKFILEYKIDSFDVIFNIILWGIGGLFVGLWSWRNINKRLKQKN